MSATPMTDQLHDRFARQYGAFVGQQDDGEGAIYDGDPADLAELSVAPPTPLRPERVADHETSASGSGEVYTEIEAEGQPRTVGLLFKDGHVETFTIPPMTMDRINMLDWHQTQIQAIHKQFLATKDKRAAARLSTQVDAAQLELLLHMIPTFPPHRFAKLNGVAFTRVMRVVEEMQREALGQADEAGGPN